MGMYSGEEVHGELNTSDASSGVEITLYRAGSATTRTIGEDEYLDIHYLEIVSANGGDCHVFVGEDSTPGAGETCVRGTFATNGGRSGEMRPHYSGIKGGKPFLVAPAGAVDVVIKGTIRKG